MDGLAGLQLGEHFQVTPKGLTVVGKPSFDEWEGLWECLLTMEKALQFAIGDAWRLIEEQFHEKASQIITARTGWTLETLRNYKWVAERVPEQVRRLDKLSFTHHQKVAHCAPREQKRWLNQAADSEPEPWTVKRLETAVKAGADVKPKVWTVIAYCASKAAQERLVRDLESRGITCKTGERRDGPAKVLDAAPRLRMVKKRKVQAS